MTASNPLVDMVNHPPHYKDGGIEVIDVIEAKQLGFHPGKKDGVPMEQDIRKAIWYLQRKLNDPILYK